MGVAGAMQVRVKSPRGIKGTNEAGAVVSSWTMPIFGVPVRSPSVMMATGDDLVLMRGRVAKALGIHNGDVVEFDLVDVGETIQLPVKIKDTIPSDVFIHDWLELGFATKFAFRAGFQEVSLEPSGKTLILPNQEMWAGMRVFEYKGTVVLNFDGASRNNPKGPAGYGFRITGGEDINN
jgi:hypothetical protein